MSKSSLSLELALKSDDFLTCKSYVDKVLFVLSVLYSENEASFAKVMSIRRGGLKVISNSEMEIERSGADPRPRKIPGSPYWMATKTSTDFKRWTLKESLNILGYSSDVFILVDSYFQ